MARALLASIVLLSGSLWAAAARADAGPRPTCHADGKGCVECWSHYGDDKEWTEKFNKCASEPTARGYVEACRHRQGAGDAVFYCPPGTSVSKGYVCGACEIGAASRGDAAALALLGLAGALAARRRRL